MSYGTVFKPENIRPVHIVGSIAPGKSTIGELIQAAFGEEGPMQFVQEPTGLWERGGVDMLRLLYDAELRAKLGVSEETVAAMFQVMTWQTRLSTTERAFQRLKGIEPVWVVLDRSLLCDKHVFSRNYAHRGVFSQPTEATLQEFWGFSIPRQGFAPLAIVYAWAPYETCHYRCDNRGRVQETKGSGLPLELFQGLEIRHNQWLFGTDELPGWVKFDGLDDIHVQFVQYDPEEDEELVINVPVIVLDCTREGEPRSPQEVFGIITSVCALDLTCLTLLGPGARPDRETLSSLLEAVEILDSLLDEGNLDPDSLYAELREVGIDGPLCMTLIASMFECGIAKQGSLYSAARQRMATIIRARLEAKGGDSG